MDTPKRLDGCPMACVLEDADNLRGVDNINRDAVRQLALNRVEWRNLLRCSKGVRVCVCVPDAGHYND